jgi:hypothetical protein
MQIPRRLALTTSSLALAAGSVLAVGALTPASAETSTAAPPTLAVGHWGCCHRHHHCHHHCCCCCGWGWDDWD